MKFPLIIGERISLRGLCEEDAYGNYPKWFNDQEVCINNRHAVFPYSEKDCLNYIQKVINSKEDLVLAILLKETNKHIGVISLQNINYISRSAELAILLGERDCWGKGYAKEASFLLISHGFRQLNLHRIYCGTSSENIAMQKLAISLGMCEEGRRRMAIYKNGRFSDILEYGLLMDEFLTKN